MHVILVKSHNVVFQRIVFVKMDLTHNDIPGAAPASAKTQMYPVRRNGPVKFHDIVRIIPRIGLSDQPCPHCLLLFFFFAPVTDPDSIHTGFHIRCRKGHIIHLIIIVQCHYHSFGSSRVCHTVIPVCFGPVGTVVIIHQSQSAVCRGIQRTPYHPGAAAPAIYGILDMRRQNSLSS